MRIQETNQHQTGNVFFYAMLLTIFLSFALILMRATNYEGRMKQYNHHMCVEVYGLNEECK